jgi:hypothetical protein
MPLMEVVGQRVATYHEHTQRQESKVVTPKQ